MPKRTADCAGQEQGLGDIAEGGLHLLRQGGSGAEAAQQPAPAQVVLDRFARVVVLPVAAQGEVEGGHRPAELGDGKADGEDDAFEVHSRGAREIDTDRQGPLLWVGRRFPLRRAVFAEGQRCLDLAGERGLADPAHTVEHEDVAAGSLQVLHGEVRTGHVPYVLGEAGHYGLPLCLPVRERLTGGDAPVVRAEQRSKVPPCHSSP
ncbi:hypothetical protein ABZZ79_23395 [Streptomyces sp. NPDC006458]|uniref:hypothetical protein n=1 Tax=Streptomyces sp. NPDC006458 TaxID=3154302 RepID=UPI0033B52871